VLGHLRLLGFPALRGFGDREHREFPVGMRDAG